MEKERINPRLTFQEVLAIEIPDESDENGHELVEYSLVMIQLWTEYLDGLWERNKYIAAENVLKHRLIAVL